jgi:cytochrome bd-type quinol oxidase subunit 2
MSEKQKTFVFNKSNYILLLIGIGLNILGFILMIGGAADTKEAFNEAELFSHVRITLAPILIVIGYIIIIYSIMKKPKKAKEEKDLD